MHDAELLDVVEGQEELLTERLDGHEAETGSRAVFVKRVAEIQRHERKHDAEMAAVNETLVNRNAVFCVLRIVLLDLLQQRQLILRVIRHFLVAAQYLDGDRLVGLRINAAQHRRKDTLSRFPNHSIFVCKDLSDEGHVVSLLVVPIVLQGRVFHVLCLLQHVLLLLDVLLPLFLLHSELLIKLVIAGKHIEHILVFRFAFLPFVLNNHISRENRH